MVCDEFALGGLAVVCPEENVGIFVEACFIEVKSSRAADVVDDVADKIEFEGAWVGGVVRPQDRDCGLLEGSSLAVQCGKTFFFPLGEGTVLHTAEERV